MITSTTNLINVGTILGDKWVILEFIAKGGMGEVYRAHQVNLNRDVAIKIISKKWIESIEEDDEEVETAMQRFQREVQAMAGIHHPNVLQIFDYGLEAIKNGLTEDEINYIAMEFVPGDTLRETMSEEGFSTEEDLIQDWIEKYFLSTLDGVEAIHKKDMVHRDLKPENVLIDGRIPKIADFGLSKSCRWKAVTQSIDFKGTIMYMPPEQLSDFRRTDHRADIYSIGKILYEAIVGKISANNNPVHFKCVGLKNPETVFFKKLDQIIRKATAEQKEDRFQSIDELRNDILKALHISEKQNENNNNRSFLYHPKWIWTGISVSVIAVVLMTFWHLLGNPGSPAPANSSGQIPLLLAGGLDVNDVRANINLKNPIASKDKTSLRYVPGGTLTLPKDQSVEVKPFYMDETPVTNLQYVSFLNQARSGIRIKNNVVIGDEKIWLMLGEVTEGYDPIIYINDKFEIKHPGHAACPVLRVTAFGALAYARFYGKRLPADVEWIYAYQGAKATFNDLLGESCEQKPIPTPVILLDANSLGIRGLNQCINEWTTQFSENQDSESHEGQPYTVIGNIWNKEDKNVGYSTIERQPWESFNEVGFRCVLDVPKNEQG